METTAGRIYKRLLKGIVSGKYAVGEKMPVERMLAVKLGCNRSTLGKALARLESEGYLERRTKAGTLVKRDRPDWTAPDGGLDAVGFLHSGFPHEAHEAILRGFNYAAAEAGVRVIAITTGNDFRKEAEFVSRLPDYGVRAAAICPIIADPTDRFAYYDAIRASRLPLVQAGYVLPSVELPTVDADYDDAVVKIVSHLADGCGARRIAFFSDYAWAGWVRQGFAGYRRALEAHGLGYDERLVFLEESLRPDYRDPVREGARMASRFLSSAGKVDAVVTTGDYLALGMLAAARKRRMPVPRDLRITGMGEFSAAVDSPISLTTVRFDFTEVGKRLFAAVAARATGRGTVRDHFVKGELVVRDSTRKSR